MDPQLARIRVELDEATERVRQLAAVVAKLPEGRWSQRAADGGWSVAHCVTHLNVTTHEFLPRLDEAIRHGRDMNLVGTGPFRRDFMGWMLCRFVEPPYKRKVDTPPKFDPQEVEAVDATLAKWDRLQGELGKRIDAADGLALNKVKVVSPFFEQMQYSLLSALMVIPAHQRRHIWQAYNALKGPEVKWPDDWPSASL